MTIEDEQSLRTKRILNFALQQSKGDASVAVDVLLRSITYLLMGADDDAKKKAGVALVQQYLQKVRNGEFGGFTTDTKPDDREVLLSLTLTEVTIVATAIFHHAEKGFAVTECKTITEKIEAACAPQEQAEAKPNAG